MRLLSENSERNQALRVNSAIFRTKTSDGTTICSHTIANVGAANTNAWGPTVYKKNFS